MKKIRLTKTDFMNGMRCGKMVWLDKHHLELRKLSAEVQALFDQGNAFGEKAKVTKKDGQFYPKMAV